MSIESEYNAHIRGLKTHKDEQPLVNDSEWKLAFYRDEVPYLTKSCSTCSQKWFIERHEGFKLRHCGIDDEIPAELIDKLVKYQIQRGIRRAPSIIQRFTGETPSLVNAF